MTIHQVHHGGGEGWKTSFLDTLLQRRDAGSLDVTVYRKPTHTDRYLDFHSHHPPKSRGDWSGACLIEPQPSPPGRTTRRRKSTIAPEYCGRMDTPVPSSTPLQTLRWDEVANGTPPREEEHRPSLVMLPYTKGVSEDVQRVCRKFCMKVVFRSGQSLHSMLFKVKDPLMVEKQAKVVYHSLQLW